MKKTILLFALIVMLICACSANTPATAAAPAKVPQVAAASATISPSTASPQLPGPTPATTATATPAAVTPPAETAIAIPEVLYYPTVTFSANVACYEGPAKNYYMTANFSIGQSTQVLGHSDDAKWLYVQTLAPNIVHTCWVPLASVKHFASANSLQVIKAAPLPTGASLAVARQKYTCGIDENNPVQKLGLSGVELGWSPSTADSSFAVKRTDDNVTIVYVGEYIDHKTPAAKIQYLLTYIIQPVNSVGISNFTTVTSATICGIQYNLLMSTIGQ